MNGYTEWFYHFVKSNGVYMIYTHSFTHSPLQWRHNGLDGVSNHQPHHCLLSRLFGRRSKKTSKLRVTGLFAGNSPGTGEFPAQMASYAENASIWWRHHAHSHFAACGDLQGSCQVQGPSVPGTSGGTHHGRVRDDHHDLRPRRGGKYQGKHRLREDDQHEADRWA